MSNDASAERPIGWKVANLREVKARDLGIRFAFGAGVSMVAALAGLAFGPTPGGLMLAFPAILPATLTLLEKKDGTEQAVQVARGATLGSSGLAAFAIACAVLFGEARVAVVLGLAAVAWAFVAITVYLAVVWFEKRGARPAPSAQAKDTYASQPWHRSCDQRSASSSAP